MTPSFVFVIYLLIYAANSMGWSNIWSDDGQDTLGDWVCRAINWDNNHCKFGEWAIGEGRCQNGYCYELCNKNYIERSTTISYYAGRSLRLSLDVHLQDDASSSDRCRIWFAYDDDNFNIDEPDWECGRPCDGVHTIDIPSSIGKNTLKIALGAYDEEHAHCNFDTIRLKYQLPPTPAPTDTPTPSPTKRPTDQTESPTSSPTTLPTAAPTRQPSPAPTKQPTLTPTSQPSPAPTQPPTITPTFIPIHDPTQNPIHHPIISSNPIEDTIQNADSDVSTTANRGDTVRASSGQDPILFVYVAASAIWFILIMTCVVAIVLCLKARKTNKSSAERRNTNGKDRGNSNHSVQHTNTTDVVSASNSDLDSSVSEQCVTIQIKTDDNPPANLIAPHAPNVRNEEVYSPEEALQGAEKETQEDEEHRADKETTTRGSVMHISDDVVPTDQGTDGNCVNEEQKEDVILDAMLSDILEMQNLDPNKIHQINLNNAVHQVNDNSDSDASDKIYQH
eukprot:501845_1